jgi:hypothetical protein
VRKAIRFVTWLLAWVGVASSGVAHAAPTPAPASQGVAVIELFTSEGCSSCPPADALLERFVGDAQRSGQAVYGLSFHVDYWDHLGWKDPYSSAAFSQRQSRYARTLGVGSLYTPQMIVNGTREFVGSNRATADAAIREALARPAPAKIRISATVRGHDVTVKYSVDGAPAGAILDVAWVDAHAESAPNRGENQGRALRHVNVVRDLSSIVLTGPPAGAVRVTRPEARDGAVIAWIQMDPGGRVLGAAAQPVPAR